VQTAQAVDAEPKYDRQLIVALVGQAADADTLDQARALDGKRREPVLPSEVVALHREPSAGPLADAGGVDALRLALAGRQRVPLPLSARSRLYLVGEGNAAARTLGGWPPAALAAQLAAAGLRAPAVISIVGNGAGRDPDREDEAQTDVDAVSFASLLHRALREEHGIVTTVNARVGAVRVLTRATRVGAATLAAGRKLTAVQPGGVANDHHAPQSKLRIRWDGDRQVRTWSD
jgi:hypothetical protein